MTFHKSNRPKLDGAFYSLESLAEVLSVSAEHLLDQAADGWLELFVRTPDNSVIFSVHEDAVDLGDPAHQLEKRLRNVGQPDEHDARPANMSSHRIDGLVLNRHDCRDLRSMRTIRKRLFGLGVKFDSGWTSDVLPQVSNLLYKEKSLPEKGWRLACYGRYSPVEFIPGVGYSQPEGIDVTVSELFVTMRSIEEFLDCIDTNKYIAELLNDQGIVTDRPHYFSEKLNELIDTGERFWRNCSANKSVDEISNAQRRARANLDSESFRAHFQKESASASLLDALSRFITPLVARQDVSASDLPSRNPHVTPELKVLMAAAKFFWGAEHVDFKVVESHPHRDQIEPFLRMMGFKNNDPIYGATLIRPEAAPKGRPIPSKRSIRPPRR